MKNNIVFENFGLALRATGVPQGLTEEALEADLRHKYEAIFDAVDEFNNRLSYQDPVLSLAISNERTDRKLYQFSFVLALSTGSGTVPFPIKLTAEKIRATQEPLDSKGNNKDGVWAANQQDDFIKSLGDAILDKLQVPHG